MKPLCKEAQMEDDSSYSTARSIPTTRSHGRPREKGKEGGRERPGGEQRKEKVKKRAGCHEKKQGQLQPTGRSGGTP